MSRGRVTDEMERRFVDAFTGPAAGDQGVAARLAGSKARTARALSEVGRRLLLRPSVQALLAAKRDDSSIVKDGKALREYWSRVIDGEVFEEIVNGKKRRSSALIKDRIRASELLAKSQGMFVRKVDVNHTGVVTIEHEAVLPDNGRDPDDDDK
jgi:hypothetical protein